MVMTAILSCPRASAFLKQDLAETRDRFCFADAAEALKGCEHQHKVHEQTGAQCDEQKDTKTTQSAIRRHTGTKLPENCRAHKRFSGGDKVGAENVSFPMRNSM